MTTATTVVPTRQRFAPGRSVQYRRIDGTVLRVPFPSAVEAAFFDRIYRLYEEGDWRGLRALFYGPENPVLEPGCLITRAVYAMPLFRAVRDLENRVGIRTGNLLAADGDGSDIEPLED